MYETKASNSRTPFGGKAAWIAFIKYIDATITPHPGPRPFQPGQSGNPGGRPRVIAELRELARAHAPEAIAELARLAKDAKSETARIAAIKELLDRAYGKPTQFVAAENDEQALNDLNLEELRAGILADLERVFPEYRLVPAKQLKVISGPEETVCERLRALVRKI